MEDEEFRRALADRIAKAVEANFDGCVKDAACRIGMGRTQLSAYISGTRCPNAEQLRSLCIGLGVSADHLLGTDAGMPDAETLATARRIEALPPEGKALLDEIARSIARHLG